MKKRIGMLVSTILWLALLVMGCASQSTSPPSTKEEPAKKEAVKEEGTKAAEEKTAEDKKEELTVGFIYTGPVGDGGWSYSHNEGRLALEEELGVKTLFIESVPEGPEVEKVMRDMIDQGAKVIFATSFGYMDYVEKVAKEHPEVIFYHCSGYKSAENMVNYFGRIYEARYLSGMVAGLKTKTDHIGYVGAFEIPEVIRGMNAFTLGVHAVNPDAKVTVRWTHTWYDPAKEKEAAVALLDEGVDIIAQHQDTAGPQQAAEERGVWSVGYHTDMTSMAPDAHLTSAVWDWAPYYIGEVKSIMDGTWKPENYWGGMEDGIVALSPLTKNAPEEAKAIVEKAEQEIKDGTLKVFSGPIKDQSGEVRVPEGVTLTDEEMLNLDWFVEGVIGNPKAE